MAQLNENTMRLVIIPTYNEVGNIGRMIDAVLALPVKINVLVVEDNSPDGTAALVKEKMAAFPIDWSKKMTKRSGQYVVGRRHRI